MQIPTQPIRAADIALGFNEFVGRVLVYSKKYKEDHRIYALGAMATCSQTPTLLFYQHQIAAGIAKYWEDQSGVLVWARIALCEAGGRLLKLLAKTFFNELCPSIETYNVDVDPPDSDGFSLVHRARMVSINCVLCGAYEGSRILRRGPTNFKMTEWDQRFIDGQPYTLPQMAFEGHTIANKWEKQAVSLNQKGDMTHEEWIRSMCS
jgi:hypothetical protein